MNLPDTLRRTYFSLLEKRRRIPVIGASFCLFAIAALAAALGGSLSGGTERPTALITAGLLAGLAALLALAGYFLLYLRRRAKKLAHDVFAFIETDLVSLHASIMELSRGNLSVRSSAADSLQAAPPAETDKGTDGRRVPHDLLQTLHDDFRKIGGHVNESIQEFNLVTDFPCLRICYVGADSFLEGRKSGTVMGRLLGGRGKVAVIMGSLVSAAQSLRRKGFQSALRDAYPDMSVVAVREDHKNREEAYAITGELLELHPDLAGIYAAQGATPARIAQAVLDAGPETAARVKIVTHDLTPDTMQYLSRGAIASTCSQNPFAQGHDPVILLYNYLLTGEQPVIVRHLTLLEEVNQTNYADHWDNDRGALVTEKAKAALIQPLPNKNDTSFKIGVILQDETGFWEPVMAGVRFAAQTLARFGVEVKAVVPEALRRMDWSAAAFIPVMEELIADGCRGISLPLFDRGLVPFINRQAAAGIAVATFNSEPVSLRGMIDAVSRHAGHLFGVSENMAAGAAENAQAVGRISATMKLLLQGSTNQLKHLSRTDELIRELIQSIDYVSEATGVSLATAERTRQIAETGHDAMRQTRAAIQELTRNARETDASIRRLNEHVLKINEITAFIDTIATQTNLLAINASIEAAQAGGEGRGFAVVADEIRTLAEQAARATADIASLIGGILASVERATVSMRASTEDMRSSTEMSDRTEAAFRDIGRAAEDNQAKVEGILTQARAMRSLSTEVQEAMEELNRLNEDNSAAVEQITGSIEQMSREINGIGEAALRLKDMGRSQEDLLAQFILE
jgi:methyl-accepting chemotaxis protein